MTIITGYMAVCKHCAGAVPQSLHLSLSWRWMRERKWTWHELLKHQNPRPVTHLLQKEHASSFFPKQFHQLITKHSNIGPYEYHFISNHTSIKMCIFLYLWYQIHNPGKENYFSGQTGQSCHEFIMHICIDLFSIETSSLHRTYSQLLNVMHVYVYIYIYIYDSL